MTNYLRPQEEYQVAARHITGRREQKLQQIDDAIQELLDIKLLECAVGQPRLRLLAAPRQTHWLGMTVTILLLFVLLVLLVGTRTAQAQSTVRRCQPLIVAHRTSTP